MEISNLRLEKSPIDGTGTGKEESQKTQVLKFIRDNPQFCRNTSAVALGKVIALRTGMKERSATQTIYTCLKNGSVSRNGSPKRSNLFINYFHPSFSDEFRDLAPEEEKERVRKVMEKVEEQNKAGVPTTIDEDGCVVSAEPAREQEEPLPVEVKKTAHGQQITFTININL